MTKRHGNITTIGITGTIGSGKSTVGKILEEMGIAVIDTDKIVHGLIASDEQTRELIIERFGQKILAQGENAAPKQIDRKALGRIVFADSAARRDLEQILHPRVRATCRCKIEEYAKDPSVKLAATLVPLLFEANVASDYDQSWVVVTDQSTLRDRLHNRDGLSEAEIEERLAAQWSQAQKAALADKIIDNSKDFAHTKEQVLALVSELVHP